MERSFPDVLARPFPEAEQMLREKGCEWTTEITRPTRDFFKTAKDCLYIVRVREQQDGSLSLVLAAKQLKEAKEVS